MLLTCILYVVILQRNIDLHLELLLNIRCLHSEEERRSKKNERKKNKHPRDGCESLGTQPVEDPSPDDNEEAVDNEGDNSKVLKEGHDEPNYGEHKV